MADGIVALYDFRPGMAINTAVALILLSAGILSTHADQGLMAVATSQSAGGFMLRRLMLAVLRRALDPGLVKCSWYPGRTIHTRIRCSVAGDRKHYAFPGSHLAERSASAHDGCRSTSCGRGITKIQR